MPTSTNVANCRVNTVSAAGLMRPVPSRCQNVECVRMVCDRPRNVAAAACRTRMGNSPISLMRRSASL